MDELELLSSAVSAFNSPTATTALKVVFAVRIICEAYSALKARQGLLGIYRNIVFGQNVPPPISQDYARELKAAPPTEKPTAPTDEK